jgi:hypothetical protein
MRDRVGSVEKEYRSYKQLAERALAQVTEPDLSAPGPGGGNSLAVICWHVSGNLRSRFTDFLTSDGEKSWRHRDEEFDARSVSREELLAKWEQGWTAALDALGTLGDEDLERSITIRGEPHRVHEALNRSLAHTAYHVGQIVYLAKAMRGADWTYLSIPPGQSETFDRKIRDTQADATGPSTT